VLRSDFRCLTDSAAYRDKKVVGMLRFIAPLQY
jgi:hypothetical protein